MLLLLITLVLNLFNNRFFFYVDYVGFFLLLLRFITFFFCFYLTENRLRLKSLFLASVFFFVSNNLLCFFFFFEFMVIPIFVIVFLIGGYRDRFMAGVYFVLYTFFSCVPFFIFVVWFFFKGETIFHSLTGAGLGDFFLFVVILGFLVKIPVYPFHLWLVKTHLEAPVYGSMILAGILIKTGVYGFYRLRFFLYRAGFYLTDFFSFICLLGSIIVSFYCLRLHDIKLLIASSSIVHMCLFIFGFFHFSFYRVFFCVIFIMRHGFASSGFFFISGNIYDTCKRRRFLLSKSFLYFNPLLCIFLLFFSLFNISFPPSINFFSEVRMVAVRVRFRFFLIPFIFIFCLLSGSYCVFIYSVLIRGSRALRFGSYFLNGFSSYILLGHFFPLSFFFFFCTLFLKFSLILK